MRLRYRHQFRDKLDKGDVGAACSTLTDRLTQVGISAGNLDDHDHDNHGNYNYDS